MARILVLLNLLIVLSACTQKNTEVYNHEFMAMGTVVSVSLADVPPAKRQAFLPRLEEDVAVIARGWSPWKEGTLSRANGLFDYQGWFNTSPSLVAMVRLSQDIYQRSGGRFDPATADLVELWGFHHDDMPDKPPKDKDIKAWLAKRATVMDVQIDAVAMKATKKNLRIDLGGIGKGYALDRLALVLKDEGIENAIINFGGDLLVMGSKGERPWSIGIRHPRQPGVIASLQARPGEAVFTSGDYERFFDFDGQHYHHILDPRTGYPARGLISVSILHDSAAWADASATALMVAGPEHWREVAAALELKDVMVIDENMQVLLTSSMKQRLDFPKPVPLQVVSLP